MSTRVSKALINISEKIAINIEKTQVTIKAKANANFLECKFKPNLVAVDLIDNALQVKPLKKSIAAFALAGTVRSNLNNAVHGLTHGFEKKLLLVGVGYRAKLSGAKQLELTLGLSHPVVFLVPDGITVECPSNTEIIIKGFDKQQVGQVAANIRAFRPPEVYKGKGIRYADEIILLKETKKKK